MPSNFGYSLDEAREAVERYARVSGSTWFSRDVVERETYWFFRVGYVGSSGVIVDKADLSLFPMSSALRVEDCFWAHEHGFSPKFVTLRILAVDDLDRTVEFLLDFAGAPAGRNPNPRRAWIRSALARLPYDCPPQNLSLAVAAFRSFESSPPFEYQLLPSQRPTEP